jgi:hypothetical protein
MTALAAVLSACGGGGAGNGGGAGGGGNLLLTDADFVGTYHAVRLGGSGTAGETSGATGTLTADGLGNADITVTVNNAGILSSPSPFGFLYDVASDGALDFRSGGGPFESGGVARDGACALLASVSPGGQPSVLALLKKGGTFSDASLSGAYHAAGFIGDVDGTTHAFGGPASFDGVSDCELDLVTVNNMGTTVTLFTIVPYTVSLNGDSAFLFPGSEAEGGVVVGGAAALWGGSTTAGEGSALYVVVRAAASADDGTFAGEYWAVRLTRDLTTGRFVAETGTVTADGSGGAAVVLAPNVDGLIGPPAGTTATYAVAADGALTFTSLGTSLRGGVSADGRLAVLGGGTTRGSNPTFMLLCRK